MKKALIFENKIYDIVDAGAIFPVASGMVWVDAPENVSLQTHEVVDEKIVLKPPPSSEQAIEEFTKCIQGRLDKFAQFLGYDNITSACTYAASSNPTFADEGKNYLKVRDEIWTKAVETINNIKSKKLPVPESGQKLLDELPWPETGD